MEEGEEGPGVLVPPAGPEAQDALVLEEVLRLATLLRHGEGVHPAPHVEEDDVPVRTVITLDDWLNVVDDIMVDVSVAEHTLPDHFIDKVSLVGLQVKRSLAEKCNNLTLSGAEVFLQVIRI